MCSSHCESVSVCVCGRVYICVCGWEVVTLLQTVQIYLYANWILVKQAGGSSQAEFLGEIEPVINYPNKS